MAQLSYSNSIIQWYLCLFLALSIVILLFVKNISKFNCRRQDGKSLCHICTDTLLSHRCTLNIASLAMLIPKSIRHLLVQKWHCLRGGLCRSPADTHPTVILIEYWQKFPQKKGERGGGSEVRWNNSHKRTTVMRWVICCFVNNVHANSVGGFSLNHIPINT